MRWENWLTSCEFAQSGDSCWDVPPEVGVVKGDVVLVG